MSDSVSLMQAQDQPDMFQGVDLHIRPGETMALVGVTGNGKSTLLPIGTPHL